MPAKPGPGASLDIAQDVASLTAEGGWLIYGIKDRPQLQVEDVVGVENPESVRTRVAAIAIAQIHPPVSLDGNVLLNPDDPERGLVVFAVPASPLAPHMVANEFWGRRDRQKTRLSEAAVARLYARRETAQADITAELDRLAAEFDPYAGSLRTGRFMVVVRPNTMQLGADLSEQLGSPYFPTLVNDLVAFTPKHPSVFGSPQQGASDSEGVVFSYEPPTGTETEVERDAVRALVHDNGMLWWVGSSTVLNVERMMEVLHSAVEFASGLAYERLGYSGSWTVAVRLTKLGGVRSSSVLAVRGDGGHPFRLTGFEESTQTSTTEMRNQAPKVVERLVGRLLRGVGVKDLYLPYDDPAKIGAKVRWGLH